jgi:hypothetical protein
MTKWRLPGPGEVLQIISAVDDTDMVLIWPEGAGFHLVFSQNDELSHTSIVPLAAESILAQLDHIGADPAVDLHRTNRVTPEYMQAIVDMKRRAEDQARRRMH